jgi:cellulose synthase/poly-beta-1,6-N-acetylglucosamine synthase-like glycosyltransferase
MGDPPPSFPSVRPGTVSVIVTVLKDPRVAQTLDSLLAQRRKPEEIWVDDGGGGDDRVRTIAGSYHARDPSVHHLDAPGSIPESRNAALRVATGEFLAFLDADEVAPPEWLAELLKPFEDPSVGFTGGPTPAMPSSLTNIGARFYDGYLQRFYERVARTHPHALPMGNSAWRASVFRRIGWLDTSMFAYGRTASEDQDAAVRAERAGYRGVYVPTASVAHDFSDITTRSLLRKQAMYSQGGYYVWRTRGTTYEASTGRLFPYVALPVLAILGAILILPGPTRLLGEWLTILGLGGLGLLALALTISGYRQDGTYPGLRYQALEILRRWATLLGAFQGFLHFGWRPAPAPPPPSPAGTAPDGERTSPRKG